MSRNVIYVGIDVDDVRDHGCALDRRTGEALQFQCRATLKGLAGQLKKVRDYFGGNELKLCYEASYMGFSLQRDLCAGLRRRGDRAVEHSPPTGHGGEDGPHRCVGPNACFLRTMKSASKPDASSITLKGRWH